MTDPIPFPGLKAVIVNPAEGTEHLPAPEMPYYVLAREGLFLHRRTELGRTFVPTKALPTTIPALTWPKGVFFFEAPPLPAELISQATHFFRRIYDKHQTEAELLITWNPEERRYRLFVPYQRTNGGGVHSVYEPTHIRTPWMVIGSIHSHCHFSAFHSSTDTNDASDFDGLHLTIGMLQNDPPQVAAMVSVNKELFHYESNIATVADLRFDQGTAPEWWDDHVFPQDTPAKKPKGLRSVTDEQWDEFRGVLTAKTRTTPSYGHTPYRYGGMWDNDEDYGHYYGARYAPTSHPTAIKPTSKQLQEALSIMDEEELVTELEFAYVDMDRWDDADFVSNFLLDKLSGAARALTALGAKTTWSVEGLARTTTTHQPTKPTTITTEVIQ